MSPASSPRLRTPNGDLRASGGAAVLLGAVSVLNLAGNVVFHTIVARHTDVQIYGAIAVLLSFGAAASVLGSGLQFAVARRVALPGASVRAEFDAGLRSCALPLIGLLAACALARPVAGYLHLPASGAVLLAVAYVAATLLAAVPSGILVGTRRYGTLALLAAGGIVTRIVLVLPFRWGADSETLALATSMAGTLLVAAPGTLVVRAIALGRDAPRAEPAEAPAAAPADEPALVLSAAQAVAPAEPPAEPPAPGRHTRAEGARGALLGGLLWASWFVAIVFARHYLAATAAGRFGTAHVAASGILFLTSSISTAFFPVFVRMGGNRPVVVGLAATAATAGVAGAGLTFAGPAILGVLYGGSFPPSWTLFGVLSVSSAIISLATYGLWVCRARRYAGRILAVAVVGALGVECLLAAVWHGSPLVLALEPGLATLLAASAAVAAAVVMAGAASRTPGSSPALQLRRAPD